MSWGYLVCCCLFGPATCSPPEMNTETAYVSAPAVFCSSWHLHLTACVVLASGPWLTCSLTLPTCAHLPWGNLPPAAVWSHSAFLSSHSGIILSAWLLPAPSCSPRHRIFLYCFQSILYSFLSFYSFSCTFCLYLIISNLLHSTSFSCQPLSLLYFSLQHLAPLNTLYMGVHMFIHILWAFSVGCLFAH